MAKVKYLVGWTTYLKTTVEIISTHETLEDAENEAGRKRTEFPKNLFFPIIYDYRGV